MVSTGIVALQLTTFAAWTVAVAVITWWLCRDPVEPKDDESESETGSSIEKEGAADEYFAGGRSLSWFVVAGSLMLTNLSTEQFVGLNGTTFREACMSGINWETHAAFAMILTATVFLPKYCASGFSTTTGFLETRYSLAVRTMACSVQLVECSLLTCPVVLFTGSKATVDIFHDGIFKGVPLWYVSTGIGILGAAYAIFGGLKAVAYSDCLNGVGLVIAGLWVPIAGLSKIGGLGALFGSDAQIGYPDILKPLVSDVHRYSEGDRTPQASEQPWPTLFTGLLLMNVYYWSTNQLIVQRAIGAKSLGEGQKGVMFAAIMKLVGFILLCFPGAIVMVMSQRGMLDSPLEKAGDGAYGVLVSQVVPDWGKGFFAAVLLGSILSSFNSALNSSATLFALEIYKPYVNPEAADSRVVYMATVFQVIMTIFSLVAAPALSGVASILGFLQSVRALLSLPVMVIFAVGFAFKLPDAFAAKAGFVLSFLVHAPFNYCSHMHAELFKEDGKLIGVSYLHVMAAGFVFGIAVMLLFTYSQSLRSLFGAPPPVESVEAAPSTKVDMRFWVWLKPIVVAILALYLILMIALQNSNITLFIMFLAMWAVSLGLLVWAPVHEPALLNESETEVSARGCTELEMAEAGPTVTLLDVIAGEDENKVQF